MGADCQGEWRPASLRSWLIRRGARGGSSIYAVFAAAATLYVAVLFFRSMQQQVQMLYATLPPDELTERLKLLGRWSAPLDDVFIHFDFARATARGYPLQWSEANGYSSGGTSLLYPFVLAIGYWAGFRQLSLMLWAGIVACTCVFGVLLAAPRLFRGLPQWAAYLAPLALLSVGALDWALFSGMEVALLLALWAGAYVAWDSLLGRLDTEPNVRPRTLVVCSLWVGLWGAGVVAALPEGAVLVAVLSIGGAAAVLRRRRAWEAASTLLASALPGACVIGAFTVANLWLTGECAAAGALAKLEMHDPFMTPEQVRQAWWFHVKYQVVRVTEYHLCDDAIHGLIVWGLAAVPLLPRATRRAALVLWISASLWVLLVALNGQVRWQNERYTMPALAWLLLAAALGMGVLLTRAQVAGRGGWLRRVAGPAAAILAATLFVVHQRQRFWEQVWFFGRASRNILEQHVRAGLRIRHHLVPTPRRVLVGDAGAIPYAADLPVLDIIGLGGYRDYPFARANRLGVASAIELIERIPAEDRPDLLALYPAWWDAFPLWFGQRITEIPVQENVICGGPSKVLYAADWRPLQLSSIPFGLKPTERVVDVLDLADLISEEEHSYALSKPRVGHVRMKMLAHPERANTALWDAGRVVDGGVSESFNLGGLDPSKAARLLVRAAPAQPATFAVLVSGHRVGEIKMLPQDSWQQFELTIPAERLDANIAVRFEGVSNTRVLHHIWIVQQR